MKTVKFRAIPKEASRVRLPESLDEWARIKAARERTTLSKIVTEALAIMKGDDPSIYGIKVGKRKPAPANQA